MAARPRPVLTPPHASASRGRVLCLHVSKTYAGIARNRPVPVLDDFTLEIEPGTFVVVIGPSGCGKTTLLNIVAGFEQLTSGEVSVDGQPVTGPGPDRGVVFQEYGLFPWLSVIQNVRYGLLERGWSRTAADREATRWLRRVHLEEHQEKYPHELSGGMRQRIALIRVLANDPRILLMDEPFAAVDALTRDVLQQELQALWESTRQTVLFVTHNVDEAIVLGDLLVVMSGRPARIKSTLEIRLPRPRDVTSSSFNRYRQLVLGQLRQEVAREGEEPDEAPVT